MIRKFLILGFFLVVCGSVPSMAQVIDVRAYSRQRGFKAYQGKPYGMPVAQPVKPDSPANSLLQESQQKAVVAESAQMPVRNEKADQTEEMQEYIKNNPHVKPDI